MICERKRKNINGKFRLLHHKVQNISITFLLMLFVLHVILRFVGLFSIFDSLVETSDSGEVGCSPPRPPPPLPASYAYGYAPPRQPLPHHPINNKRFPSLQGKNKLTIFFFAVILGNLSFKIRCASAISRNSEEQDPQQARKKVDCYMEEKVDEGKRTFDLYSREGIDNFHAFLVGHYHLRIESFEKGCIKITVKCRTLEILERLWDDYRSGHLNAVAEECLITEKVKNKLDMETITLTTTILEEDYIACKWSLMEISGTF